MYKILKNRKKITGWITMLGEETYDVMSYYEAGVTRLQSGRYSADTVKKRRRK